MRIINFILICSGLLFIPACGRVKAVNSPFPAVEVVQALQKDIPVPKEWVGVTYGMVDAVIRAQVTGYLISQNYKDGDFVKKGDVLFEIDPRLYQAILDQAKATLSQQEALYMNAKVNLDRFRPLAAENVVSKSDLDNAIGQERSTMGVVLSAKAAVEKAELDLSFTKITSPIDGVAGFAQRQIGDLVGPLQDGQLTTVSQINPIKMYINLGEQDYFNYKKSFQITDEVNKRTEKLESELILSGGETYPHKGKFYAIDRQVDLKTGTLQLALEFPNPDNVLRPGMFARARITEVITGAIVIPQESVTELQGSSQVAVVGADNRVELRSVKAEERVGDLRVIREGLKPGETVIVEGIQKVKHGTLVVLKPFTGNSPAGGQHHEHR
ncbi:MAG: efflux RND transporter periplasmic adaptor subunit [Victivallales bacterium]|jgi:membrane fusion protein (multidrug efflux system)